MGGQVRDPLAIYEGKLKGEICWIVGCGTSLDSINLRALSGRYIFALNAAIELFIDPKTFTDAWWFFWDLRAWREVWPRIERGWPRIKALVNHRALENMRSLRKSGRYIEYADAFKPERVVVESALMVADFMGFDEIYLAGVDFVVRPGRAYARDFSWKKCHFWDPRDKNTDSKSCRDMAKAVRAVLPRLNHSKVFTTSHLFPDRELIPYVEYEDAIGRTEREPRRDRPPL